MIRRTVALLAFVVAISAGLTDPAGGLVFVKDSAALRECEKFMAQMKTFSQRKDVTGTDVLDSLGLGATQHCQSLADFESGVQKAFGEQAVRRITDFIVRSCDQQVTKAFYASRLCAQARTAGLNSESAKPAVPSSATSTTAPAYRTVVSEKAGFRIAVPEMWVSIDLTLGDAKVKADLKALKAANPSVDLADLATARANRLQFLATSTSEDNSTVLIARRSTNRQQVRSFLEQNGYQDIDVATATVAGLPAIRGAGTYAFRTESPRRLTEYGLMDKKTRIAIVFDTPHDAIHSAIVEHMIESLVLTH